jgi:glycosyltransferase involved in cell wall biosynthesis
MLLKRFGKIKQPLVIASMGTFSAGAIQLKSAKKKLFFTSCKLLGLFKKVQWSVTSELEAQDVQRHIGKNAVCHVAEDLPRKPLGQILKQDETAFRGIFLSRICAMKNLSYALEVLQQLKSRVVFDIYGVIEDVSYWEKCQKQIQALPPNVTVTYKGVAEPDKVMEIFSEYDFFLFPTLGENYGHVIFESLAGGCLPIISDQTPWLELTEKGIGWVLSLKDKQSFVGAIEKLSEMPTQQLRVMQHSPNRYAAEKYTQSVQNTGYRKVFEM